MCARGLRLTVVLGDPGVPGNGGGSVVRRGYEEAEAVALPLWYA